MKKNEKKPCENCVWKVGDTGSDKIVVCSFSYCRRREYEKIAQEIEKANGNNGKNTEP